MKTQQTDQKWDDIVFENRNKIYGAYAIRQSYPVNVVRALLLCVGALAGVFLFPQSPVKPVTDTNEDDVPHDPIPEPRIIPVRPKEIVQVKRTNVTLVPTRITTSEVPDIKQEEDISVETSGLSDRTEGTFVETGNSDIPAVEIVEPAKPQPIVSFAEIMPSYAGGNSEMIKFIQKKLHYPAYAARMGITGTVYVSFVVSTSGAIIDVDIVKGIDKSCDEEAMRVISLMNKWKPGIQNKMPVAVRMVLPIKFVTGE